MPKKRKKKIKMKCELCPRDCSSSEYKDYLPSNSVEFKNHYTVNGKKICAKCWNRYMRQMNKWKKLPPYGKKRKILEEMVKMKIFEFPTMSVEDLRKKATKIVKTEYPEFFEGYSE